MENYSSSELQDESCPVDCLMEQNSINSQDSQSSNYLKKPRKIWTPDDRDNWIQKAKNSEENKGSFETYNFKVLPKKLNELQDEQAAKATEITADTIMSKNNFKPFSLGFYVILIENIKKNQYIGQYYGRKIKILIKGGTAHNFLLPEHNLSSSDLDIVIYIDPYCHPKEFALIQKSLHIIVLQTLSQYKRTLDSMLFLAPSQSTVPNLWGMSTETIEDFKLDHIMAMEKAGLISPFLSNDIRNKCSRHSIVLVNSRVHDQSVVRVDIPHFHMCEKIPLKYTPLFCSYNETIHDVEREFHLYRMKLNCLTEKTGKRVACDFIDITILSRNDVELQDFWKYSRITSVYEKSIDMWIDVPDLVSCIKDLHKVLYVYDCPENKKEKRKKKLELLTQVLHQV